MKNIFRLLMVASVGALAASALSPARAQQVEPAAVRTLIDAGTLVGALNGQVERYLGVPFAKPPVGALRWAPPQPPAAWEGERDATKYQLPCFQNTNPDGVTPNGGGVSGPSSEDCLYLNVYKPRRVRGAPVMVWFYGGGNEVGGAHLPTYDGQSFAERGVVVVTLNYRLGAAGWFAHPKLTAAAGKDEPLVSYGSMDQTEALRWVQRNIAAFGGDPKNVTIFGQSAGGYGVYAQLVAPSAQGLFHKAMVHSATYVRANPSLAEVEARGVARAAAWGLDGANATLEQLRAVPVEKLGGPPLGGAVDGRYFVEPWMTSLPFKRHARVPFLVGGNSGEGALWARDRWIASQFAEAGVPAFQYHFSHVRDGLDQAAGAQHSAELRFVWNTLREWASPENDAVAASMHPCWVAFAFYKGTGSLDCGNGIVWPAFTATEHPVVEFTSTGATVHEEFRSDEEWIDTLSAR